MSSKKPASTQQTILLGSGAALAFGFAAWNISRTMGPPPVTAPTPPSVASAPATGTASAPQPAAPTGSAPLPNNAAASPFASTSDSAVLTRASGLLPTQPQTTAAPPRTPAASSEATLAVEANPFAPITAAPRAAMPSVTVAPAPPLTVAPTGTAPIDMRRAGQPTLPGGAMAAYSPLTARPLNTVPSPASAANLAPAVTPELAGTLIGDNPCAVFRADKGLVTVPIGEAFGEWKVVSIGYGEAVVRGRGTTLRLGAGVGTASSMVNRTQESSRDGSQIAQTSAPSDSYREKGFSGSRRMAFHTADGSELPSRYEDGGSAAVGAISRDANDDMLPPLSDSPFSRGNLRTEGKTALSPEPEERRASARAMVQVVVPELPPVEGDPTDPTYNHAVTTLMGLAPARSAARVTRLHHVGSTVKLHRHTRRRHRHHRGFGSYVYNYHGERVLLHRHASHYRSGSIFAHS